MDNNNSSNNSSNTNRQLKIVYTITERGERSYWTRIGVAHVNRDGSLNIRLEAMPVNGTMQVRDWTPREEQASKRGNGAGVGHEDLPEAFS